MPDAAFFKDTVKRKSSEYATCRLCGLAGLDMKAVRRHHHLVRCTAFETLLGKSFVEWASAQQMQLSAEVLSAAEVVARKRVATAVVPVHPAGLGVKRQRCGPIFSPVKGSGGGDSSNILSCGGQKVLLGRLSKETIHDFQMRWARYGPYSKP